ncbi:serine hydrolase domain-containing protein, partial [Puia sp.]|uniref:serine hydrolase domain-containing protein n=1 Tax=Puia sp. TaxID=2045100 RepID=UPI002F416DEE
MNNPKLPGCLLATILLLSLQTNAQFSVEKAHALVDAYVRAERVNGAVLVAQKGTILLEEGYGYQDAAAKKKNEGRTIFQIGSLTKQFTSAVIMQLQQEKKLSVKDKLSKYFPGLPFADSVTLENLLTHTSGIYNYTQNAAFMKNQATLPHSHEEMLALFKDKPLGFAPGSKYEYSNSNYVLLGYIIEKVTGKPYPQVVRERILTPLKMTSSGFDFTHLSSPYKAVGYSRLGNDLQPAPIVDSTASFSAGALYSTVEDLYKWDRALNTTAIL